MPLSFRKKFLSSHNAARKVRRADAFVILLVTVVTLFSDLAVAVLCGTVLSCLMFVWESSENIRVTTMTMDDHKVYEVHGVLFFGSTTKFLDLFDPVNDPAKITLVFDNGDIGDYSALEALNTLGERYGTYNKVVTVQKLRHSSNKLLRKAQSLLKMEVEFEIDSENQLPTHGSHRLHIENYQGTLLAPARSVTTGQLVHHDPKVLGPPLGTEKAVEAIPETVPVHTLV